MLLAADVGGTKTSLGIYSTESGPREPIAESTLPSGRYASLEELVSEFLSGLRIKADRASFGVAGPVLGGRARITNLPWVIDAAHLRGALNLRSVRLFNDIEAIAYGVPLLMSEDLRTLNEGEPVKHGTWAVIASGTGLGEAFLIWNGERYQAYPSEGGHADFGPNSTVEIELLGYLKNKLGHVSLERICSGQGFPNVYAFLKERGYEKEQDWLAMEMSSAEDPTPVIINAALNTERRCELCSAALSVFVSALGAEAGNLALKVVATGGVFIGGGIPPRIISLLNDGIFMESFTNKGRFSEMVSRIPVHVILNPKVALIGAAFHGLEISRK
jgi:glucokinase